MAKLVPERVAHLVVWANSLRRRELVRYDAVRVRRPPLPSSANLLADRSAQRRRETNPEEETALMRTLRQLSVQLPVSTIVERGANPLAARAKIG